MISTVRLRCERALGNVMAKVEIYTTPLCPFCFRAKKLLDRKGVVYEEIDLWKYPDRRPEMMSRADNRHTVPQIFINDEGIGGSDELAMLDGSGRLEVLLRDPYEASST